MKRLILLLLLTACDHASEMHACRTLCEPRLVKEFSSTDGHKVSCICDEKMRVEK